jgi:hypothetical protein
MMPFNLKAVAEEVASRLSHIQAGTELTLAMVARSRERVEQSRSLLDLRQRPGIQPANR